jgi:hypothetical protein
MAVLLLFPTVLSLLVFAAHLFRSQGFLPVLPILLCLPLLFVPRGFVARFFQVLLLIAALEWTRSDVALALEREDAGKPWLRAVLIFAVVALFTLFSGILFYTRTLLRVYPRLYDD